MKIRQSPPRYKSLSLPGAASAMLSCLESASSPSARRPSLGREDAVLPVCRAPPLAFVRRKHPSTTLGPCDPIYLRGSPTPRQRLQHRLA